VVEEVRTHFESLVFDTIIHRNSKISEAPSYGKPVIAFDIDSKGSLNYLQLAQEVINNNESVATSN
jgi:chromosome partitioning protein